MSVMGIFLTILVLYEAIRHVRGEFTEVALARLCQTMTLTQNFIVPAFLGVSQLRLFDAYRLYKRTARMSVQLRKKHEVLSDSGYIATENTGILSSILNFLDRHSLTLGLVFTILLGSIWAIIFGSTRYKTVEECGLDLIPTIPSIVSVASEILITMVILKLCRTESHL